jgi:hypothetical protein
VGTIFEGSIAPSSHFRQTRVTISLFPSFFDVNIDFKISHDAFFPSSYEYSSFRRSSGLLMKFFSAVENNI